jgi:hypothetical protein
MQLVFPNLINSRSDAKRFRSGHFPEHCYSYAISHYPNRRWRRKLVIFGVDFRFRGTRQVSVEELPFRHGPSPS